MDKIKVIAVVGPTASGKTSLAVSIALAVGGEVVSADSMQIYKGMDIATAKPSLEEMRAVPHHLIDFLEPDETYSVAQYVNDAGKCIENIAARDKIPIVAGGTGLYVDSLLNGTDFAFVPDNNEIRGKLKLKAEKDGYAALLDELRSVDAETASYLHENNKGRIIRALEIYYLTGKTASELRRKSREKETPYNALYIYIDYRDRQKLYDRIEKRVDIMLRSGLLEEAKKYISLSETTTARQAIGYKELKPYFDSEITLEEAVSNLKKETRHYAKRQMTWFRRNKDMFKVYPDEDPNFTETAINKAKEFLRQYRTISD